MMPALAPLLEQAVSLLLTLLLALGTLAARRAADWLKLAADSRAREALLDVVELVVSVAQERAEAAIRRYAAHPHLPPGEADAHRRDVWSSEIWDAARYVAARMPDAARRLGADEHALRDMVRRRLEAAGVTLG